MSRTASIIGANAREAIDSLRKAKLRTLLGLISVMIGICSVITMVSLGEIAKHQARKEFEALGTDILVITKSDDAVSSENPTANIMLSDAIELPRAVTTIAAAAPRVSEYGVFQYSGERIGEGNVQGVTADFAKVNQIEVNEGRFVSNLDVERYFCVIGSEIADAMRSAGARRIVGELIGIEDHLFTVVGELQAKEESYLLPFVVDANQSVFIPISTSARLNPDSQIEVVIARSMVGVHYEAAVADVQSYFDRTSPDLILEIVTAKELIGQMESQMQTYTLLLGAIGSIALIVGGVGIMNIMLVSVAERRREIAVRRALGARRGDIQNQFLIESIILTVSGGVLGGLAGLVATWAICQYTGWDYLISGVSVASGIFVSAIVGLFFGFQPARQAARLDPIAGLQSE